MSVTALEALVATLPARKSRKLTLAIEEARRAAGAVVEPQAPANRHGCGYMRRAFSDPEGILTDAMRLLKDVQYDTLVGTGVSGCVVVPALARALGRHFLIVRKDGDGSHSGHHVEGSLGTRWVFVDDLVAGGDTFRRCALRVAEADSNTECAGLFLYAHRGFGTEAGYYAGLASVGVW